MAIKPGYIAKEAASSVRRNFLMFTAAILAVAISLMLVGSVLMLERVVRNLTFQFRDNVEINVFIRDEADASDTQLSKMGDEIRDIPEVSGLTYVSKGEAYDEFQDMFSNQPALVDSIDEETLPASFRVKLSDPDALDDVSTRIEKIAGVDEIKNARDQVERVNSVLRVLRLSVLAAAGILLGAAAVLISNTIRLAIFARRREIAIMKLVGATNWFIRWPFLIEGLAQGLLGAGIAVIVLWLVQGVAVDWVGDIAPFIPLGISSTWRLLVSALVVLAGALIAVAGTTFSLRRYLDV